jgi:hypothetical protein
VTLTVIFDAQFQNCGNHDSSPAIYRRWQSPPGLAFSPLNGDDQLYRRAGLATTIARPMRVIRQWPRLHQKPRNCGLLEVIDYFEDSLPKRIEFNRRTLNTHVLTLLEMRTAT